FFFQAEDGIRDFHVTGVQTCALPISRLGKVVFQQVDQGCAHVRDIVHVLKYRKPFDGIEGVIQKMRIDLCLQYLELQFRLAFLRSEERRVGKECRSRWKRYERHKT